MTETIKDECAHCGAKFSTTLSYSYATDAHESFLDAHKMCFDTNTSKTPQPSSSEWNAEERREVWLEGYRKGVEDTLKGSVA